MDLSQRYATDSEVSFQKLEDATVLVHLGSGRIHHTNVTGSRVWELLDQGQSVGDILRALEAEFDAEPDQLRREVETFIAQLETEKMIRPAGDE